MTSRPVRRQCHPEVVRAVGQRRVAHLGERTLRQIGPGERLRRGVAGLRQVHPEGAGVRDRRDIRHRQGPAGRHPGRRPVGAGEVEAPVGGQAPAAQLPVRDPLPVPAADVRHAQVVPRGERPAVRGDRRAARRRARTLTALGRARHDPAHRIRRGPVGVRRRRGPQRRQQRGHQGRRERGAVCGRPGHPGRLLRRGGNAVGRRGGGAFRAVRMNGRARSCPGRCGAWRPFLANRCAPRVGSRPVRGFPRYPGVPRAAYRSSAAGPPGDPEGAAARASGRPKGAGRRVPGHRPQTDGRRPAFGNTPRAGGPDGADGAPVGPPFSFSPPPDTLRYRTRCFLSSGTFVLPDVPKCGCPTG